MTVERMDVFNGIKNPPTEKTHGQKHGGKI
jgi:hypothetical protein